MAIKIEFDSNNNPEQPTLVLATRNGKLLGKLPAVSIQTTDVLNGASELRFDVYKLPDANEKQIELWNSLVDFKTVWAREWNVFFEIEVELEESEHVVKHVTAKSLGEAELSQIMLYNIEINTEDDIARDDYEPTVLYDSAHPNKSLLNRIMEKAPHYTVKFVDTSIRNIQRTFSFDNKSLYDALMEISEEMDCLFVIKCYFDNRVMKREIYAYDLLSYCQTCGYRGSFTGECPECGGSTITEGYGNDTTIFINRENLANNINYTTDNGSVKNCFRLKCGDDYMTAAVVACNPNGSPYIYYITDDVKADMSDDLVNKIEEYDEKYNTCQNSNIISMTGDGDGLIDEGSNERRTWREAYNDVVSDYNLTDYPECPSSIVGYIGLMEILYQTIGFDYYLSHEMMPTVTIPTTSAAAELAKITSSNVGYVGVKSLTSISDASINSAILHMAKTVVDGRYKVEIEGTPTSTNNTTYYTWSGKFTVTSYSDEEDTATSSSNVTLYVTGDAQTYLNNCITRTLSNKVTDEITDMVSLFELSNANFEVELRKYSLACLTSIHDACQACVDILIAQGVADGQTWGTSIYNSLYTNGYYAKLGLIETELSLRESEIKAIQDLTSYLRYAQNKYHEYLDFEQFLGDELFLEFTSYRREDTYQNDNYISDGLSDAEVFANALDFLKVARNEIYKSATLQHSISSTLKNLLCMHEFAPIVNYFAVGNWIRIRVDGRIYKLRLISYTVDFDNMDELQVEFSDLTYYNDSFSDIESILNSASSMATSYDGVKKQAKKGNATNEQLENWVEKGLDLTNMKIVNSADNQDVKWDDHGILLREYIPYSDSYDSNQVKIINNGLYFTNDNWATSKAGIGSFYITNPENGQLENKYGVVADTVVGRIILGEQVYIANAGNTFKVDEDGVVVSNGTNSVSINPGATYLFDIKKGDNDLLYVDANGDLNVSGNVHATSLTLGPDASIPYSAITDFPEGQSSQDLSVYIQKNGQLGIAPSDEDMPTVTGSTGFKVSASGLLVANNAVIFGTIFSSVGRIAGWNITPSYIHNNIPITSGVSGTEYDVFLHAPTTTPTTNTKAFAVSTRSYDGSNYGDYVFPFYVTYGGKLHATDAEIAGNITAYSGSIGGFNITSSSNTGTSANGGHAYTTSLYAHSYDGSTYEYEVGIKGDGNDTAQDNTSTNHAFYIKRINAGNAWNHSSAIDVFYVNKNGKLYAADAEIAGGITAKYGTIGGFTISNSSNTGTSANGGHCYPTSLYAHSYDGTYEYEVGIKGDGNDANAQNSTSTNLAFYVKGIAGGSTWAAPTTLFSVNKRGKLYAMDADISGRVTASSGSIGGWLVDGEHLYKRTNVTSGTASTQYGAYMQAPASITPSSTSAFGIYYRAYNGGDVESDASYGNWTYPFRVYYDGRVECSNISITGGSMNINAASQDDNKIILTNTRGVTNISRNAVVSTRFAPNGIAAYTDWVPNSAAYDNVGTYTLYQPHYIGLFVNGYDHDPSGTSTTTDIRYATIHQGVAMNSNGTNYVPFLYLRKPGTRTAVVEVCQGTTQCGYISVKDSTGYNRAYMSGDAGIIGVTSADGTVYAYMRGDTGAVVSSTNTFTTSDRNCKRNITYLNKAESASNVYRFKPARFQYNYGDDKYHHGFIVQDIEESISDSEWGVIGSTGECQEMIMQNREMRPVYKTLAYSELIADIVATVQLQHEQIELQNKEIELLKQQLAVLTA